MKKLLLALLLLPSIALAQTAGTINFVLDVTSSPSSAIPKLTWSTTPTAASCTASGDAAWTGTKTPGGTQTLPATNKSATYRIDCSWSNLDARLDWTPPTQNTDGSTLTTGTGYRIAYGKQGAAQDQTATVTPLSALTKTLVLPSAGTWTFSLTTLTSTGAESLPTNLVSVTTGTATANKSVALSLNIPLPPTNVTGTAQ